MRHLFAYGTLMCPDIMREVSGVSLVHVRAALNGYRRWCVRGEEYPALVPDGDGRVEGVLYRGVPDCAWQRLDLFEGDMYTRTGVDVGIGTSTTLGAQTYVVRPEYVWQLDRREWSLDGFLREGKKRFRAEYGGYSSIHPTQQRRQHA